MVELEIGAAGTLAKVQYVSPDGCRLFLEYRNGQSTSASSVQPTQFDVGDVVLVQGNSLESAPAELWVDEAWIGVVRLKLSDITVLDAGGHWRKVPTTHDIDYVVGNTVEASNLDGVVRVLQKEPIKYLELPEPDRSDIERFKARRPSKPESFEDFGGLHEVIRRAQDLIEVPLKQRERLAKIGARPIKGVLFTGAPGTGKTMLARIIANQSDAEFYEISGPEIFSKWYGQSEEILRLIFEDARNQMDQSSSSMRSTASPPNETTTLTKPLVASWRSSSHAWTALRRMTTSW